MTRAERGLAVVIDRDACMAAGECQRLVPTLFGVDEDGVATLVGDPATHDVAGVADAVASCPNFALALRTRGGDGDADAS